jgi:hypothetical protein
MRKLPALMVLTVLASSIAFARVVLPPPGGKFCKNNPTSNTGVCHYSGDKVDDCITSVETRKDCYGVGSD